MLVYLKVLSMVTAPLTEECWDDDEEPPSSILPGSKLEGDPSLDYHPSATSGFLLDRAEDFLTADDPTQVTGEFSSSFTTTPTLLGLRTRH